MQNVLLIDIFACNLFVDLIKMYVKRTITTTIIVAWTHTQERNQEVKTKARMVCATDTVNNLYSSSHNNVLV